MTPEERSVYDQASWIERRYLDAPPPTFWFVVFEDGGGAALLGAALSALAAATSYARPVEATIYTAAAFVFVASFVAFWVHARRRWRRNRKRCFELVVKYIANRQGEGAAHDTKS
jgi:hypothetical protein